MNALKKTTVAVFLLCLAASLWAQSESLVGVVVSVHDGDTLTLLVDKTTYKIRLAEIDAPELSQAFGQKARQFLADRTFRRTVEVVTQGQDQYGRTIGTVLVGGVSVSRALVENGFAWHYKAFSKDASLDVLEAQARNSRWGLWADPAPTPPWNFRKSKG